MKKIIISISIAAVLAVLFIAGYLFLLLLIIPIRRTLYGSLNILMTSLKERHPNSEIYFLTSIFRNMHYNEAIPFTGTVNSNGDTVGDFAQAVIKCAKMHEVSVLDLYSESGMNENNIERFTNDGTHSNVIGQFMIAFRVKKIIDE